MAILKCKMCGGDIVVNDEKTFGTCDYCGSTMTFPKVSDDQRAARFNRGNHFRRQGDFDKALAVYETIVNEDDADAEAHWCCALCRFGIEYVEDPNTFEYLPTCHRASFDSFLEDPDYLAALEHSEGITKKQYQKDAAKIADVQRGILATSQNEEPFDVFICYKETDDNTKERTRDSLDAQDIYYQLTQEGYRVFFSRITLEDKVGTEYEPYIFAALNSAKVMIALGSKPEYLNAVWVKNEWSRFLAMMRKDRSKLLLPCYRDMEPYDLPEQLSVLQSYDMSKIGFMQDLIRGVKKVLKKDEPKTTVIKEVYSGGGNTNVASLLERAFLFLEDGKWQDANTYCEKVLDIDPKNAEAYLGKLMADLQVKTRKQLAECAEPFDDSENYNKVIRFGDEKLDSEMRGYIDHINKRNEKARLNGIYYSAVKAMSEATSEAAYKSAAATFKTISGFKDADALAEQCLDKAEERRIAAEKAAEKRKKKLKTIAVICIPVLCVCIALIIVFTTVIMPIIKDNVALEKLKSAEIGDYVIFGSYEQDNDTSNGKEDIEWLVLAKEGDKALVISRYALDCKQYNTSFRDVTWETCSLREWLNGTFFSNSFSSDERNMVQSTTVTAEINPSYSTSPGNNTTDKVFLLSITESNKYFSSDRDRKCKGTDYCYARGAYQTSIGYCWWWLRSPGYDTNIAANVSSDGSVFNYGNSVHNSNGAVRPAMWINLES